MKTVLLFLLATVPCYARLGETEDQCIARYGPETVVQTTEHAKLTKFQKDDFTIVITFWNKVAVGLIFTKTSGSDLTREEVDEIVLKSADAQGWSKPSDSADDLVWLGYDDQPEHRAQWDYHGTLSISGPYVMDADAELQKNDAPEKKTTDGL